MSDDSNVENTFYGALLSVSCALILSDYLIEYTHKFLIYFFACIIVLVKIVKLELLREKFRPWWFCISVIFSAVIVFALYKGSMIGRLSSPEVDGLLTKWFFFFLVLLSWLITSKQRWFISCLRNLRLFMKLSEMWILNKLKG